MNTRNRAHYLDMLDRNQRRGAGRNGSIMKTPVHPIHTGNHKCAFCEKVFKSQESAREHERTYHRRLIKKYLSKPKRPLVYVK